MTLLAVMIEDCINALLSTCNYGRADHLVTRSLLYKILGCVIFFHLSYPYKINNHFNFTYSCKSMFGSTLKTIHVHARNTNKLCTY